MTLALNFDWLTNLLAIIFVVACLYDARYDEYGTLTLSAAVMSLIVMAIELFVKPAFDMAL
ncbi:hypothetical protein LMG24238_05522 [Paraburkholderia sediminicola]|uniref:Uncharacterized protein n=1 Tax=Paraburkholderia sediminicola TaxID=458836 RepID=A0A6J5C6I2_9BURK|nr:hypothetical protein [Paraburkholderia sediminicola]CAB3728709.1 hypothetical protein LMG24238_05522 [Paraburkholderia sediminicola]